MAAPTVTIVVTDANLRVGETSLVTFTFSEAVDSASFLTNATKTFPSGAIGALTTVDNITWTATFTPTPSTEDATNVVSVDMSAVFDAAHAFAGAGVANSNTYAVDTLRPTATIVVADTALAAGETSLVTITFSEAVTGFTNADLSVESGTISAVASADGGVTWTATLTPSLGVTDASNLVTLDNTGVTDAATNAGTGTTVSGAYAVDTVRPTATIVVADAALAAGETSLVTLTFSEAVTGLTTADLTVANGALAGLASADGGVTWTATLTPTAAITDTTNIVTLDNTGVTDAAGNTGTGTTDSNTYAIDTARPTATIVVADTALAAGETSLVTVTFSEAVTGFSNADLSVESGTISAVASLDGGVTWTATLTPTLGVTDASNLITLANTGVTDAAGNTGTSTTSSNAYAVDTARPTATIAVADAALAAGETSLVTLTFSEAVTGLTTADLTVANGALAGLASADGGVTWTATLTPTAAITDKTNVVTLDNTGVTDAAGNIGTGTTDSNTYAIDTARPTATIVVTDAALAAGETSLVTLTFSEAVTGLTTADLTVANGALAGLASIDGGLTWTATLTPTTSITDTTNVVTLDNTGVADIAGNTGTGTATSNNYAIDTARPTATIVVADAALAAGETSLVTVTFSEAVTGFSNADLSVENGTISAVASLDGGVTWTTTLTPSLGVSDASNVITLANTGVADAAGNSGLSTTASNVYAVDGAGPTATIVLTDPALALGEASQVTVTFSEAVTGFTAADLTVEGGTLSGFTSGDNTIFRATFTPTASLIDATNVMTLDNSGVTDAVGNAGVGTSTSANYTIDTVTVPVPPTSPGPTTPPVLPVEIPGTIGADEIYGNDNGNLILAGEANDRASGGIGSDTIAGEAGNDTLQGNIGSDSVSGGAGSDMVLGGQDTDWLQGNGEADYMSGDKGSDTVLGGQGNDTVYGGESNDYVSGDLGDDIVRGGQGADMVLGGAGNDFVSGDRGNDTLAGGLGADTFHSFGAAEMDKVLDFNLAEGDRVMLDAGTVYTLAQVGLDTVITMDGGALMTLANVQLATLTPGWIFLG